MTLKTYSRRYLAGDFDPGSLDAVESIFEELRQRSIGSVGDLEQWIRDWSELEAALDEDGSRRFVDHTCNTTDESVKARYLEWVEKIEPVARKRFFELQKALTESKFLEELDAEEFGVWIRHTRNAVEIFRDENIPLLTEDTKLESQYDEIFGAMMVEFQGEERTLPQMNLYLQETDRDLRESAYRGLWERILRDREEIEAIYDRQVELRTNLALNAGFDNYRDYRFRQLARFDYTPHDCFRFHDAIHGVAVPLAAKRLERRRQKLGLDALRPWDVSVDPAGRPPLRPFDGGKALSEGCHRIFSRVHPALGDHFAVMVENELLDLDTRKGKAPGGYQCTMQERRVPFIFMNAAGLQADVETLLHEGGHAFHALESRHQPLCANRNSPIEFAEVASMSMELLAGPQLGEFYPSQEELRRARIEHLEGVIGIFPWVATIDAFQHWIYTHPEHDREARRQKWVEIYGQFLPSLDWSGIEEFRDHRWLRQSHLFGVPFYYVEYAIAQLGALQVWMNYRRDPDDAVAAYRHALSLGNTRSLPRLFEAAKTRFDFSEETLGELLQEVDREITRLEEE